MNPERGPEAEAVSMLPETFADDTAKMDGGIGPGAPGSATDAVIEVEELADGFRFTVPPPGMGLWKRAGWAWLVVGNVLIIAAGITAAVIHQALGTAGSGWVLLVIWAAAGAMILIGLVLADTGLSYLLGRRIIEVRGNVIRVSRQASMFGMGRRLPLVRLRRLRVAMAEDGGKDADLQEFASAAAKSTRYALFVELDSGVKKKIVPWLSYRYVSDLARALAQAIERQYEVHGVAVEPPVVQIDPVAVERAADDAIERTLPEASDIEVKQGEAELSIVVPKLPLFRGKGGQSVAGMLFSTLGAALLGVFIFSGFSWIWVFFLAPAAVTWGRFVTDRIGERETYLDVIGESLLVSSASIRGIKQYQWPRDQIKAIRRGKSDLEINDEKLPQLDIIAIEGDLPENTETRKHGFLVGRSREEINWIAWRLRTALHVPPNGAVEDVEAAEDDEDDGSWF